MGEFEIIANIRRFAETVPVSGVVRLGGGDDCCLLAPRPGEELAASTDTVVEGVHFRLDYFSLYQVGAKAMAAALSDLAAVAASPAAALAAVAMPRHKGAQEAEELALGLIETGRKYGCPLVGGDLTSGDGPLVVNVTVFGTLPAGRAVLRSGAAAGDEVWVTGRPGDAAAVLACLEAELGAAKVRLPEPAPHLRKKFLLPTPRLKEALILAGEGPPSAMIDISDGLAADLGHLLDSSQAGARLLSQSFPKSGFAASVAEALGLGAEHFFLHGGEDYELCLTAAPGALDSAVERLKKNRCATLHRIGYITAETGKMVLERPDGSLEQVRKKGYDHFDKSPA
ncbi:MAG: thiamine-phosphate kinase [Candidatus Glassbacteria bacterium]|nr:thiamine-phosphate kinase [Candidatus Glassbacteria bacterium]